MKVAILAGGHGARLAEETQVRPKAMVEIVGRPILWHIMMHYSRYKLSGFAGGDGSASASKSRRWSSSSPYKQGKFIPGSDHAVIGPEARPAHTIPAW